MLTRIKSESTYRNFQVWNEYIWGDMAAALSLAIQGNSLLVYYMTPTLYDTICINPYLTPSDPGMNPMYPLGETMVSIDNIKDTL